MLKIEEFKANFLGGARPNKFEVEVPNLPDKARFLIKSSTLPGGNIGEVIFNYQGTQAKFAGDKTFNDWEVTMIIDEDYAGERELRGWHDLIKQTDSGLGASPSEYKRDCFITHYSHSGEVISQFKLVGTWIKTIPDAPLSWDTTDSNMEMSFTLAYDYPERVE